ncbi:MAG TPA: zinc-dependent metalloprotease [Acidimicrobiia bacterium]|nr:zinc-dependent metalloprotease [Acidimicrobiia bacterium]
MSKVDWGTATAVASRFSGEYPLAGTYHERKFALTAPGLVARASELVTIETGLELPGAPNVEVITRAQWVDTNIAAFTALLAPLRAAIAERAGTDDQESVPTGTDSDGGGGIAARIMGVELGALLGFLSKRVLGQYELVLPTGDEEVGDSVFFVGANVLAMERQHEFRPSHFRFWVALHESAHRAQFKGVPWMRGYFLSLVDDLVGTAEREHGRMARIATDIIEARNRGEDPVGDTGILGLLASHGQREVLDRVQALMSLLEGHGHVVMDRIGEREIVDVDRMSRVLSARRNDPKTQRLMRLIGMEMKLKQYDLGASFIRGVEQRASWDTLSMAWESPEALPNLAEIEDPGSWLDRMAG